MSLRINIDELKRAGFDAGGGPIWHYKGKPFTGILFCNEDDGTLGYERECINGYEDGWFRAYHPNGKKSKEYQKIDNVRVKGTYKEWDENGNPI